MAESNYRVTGHSVSAVNGLYIYDSSLTNSATDSRIWKHESGSYYICRPYNTSFSSSYWCIAASYNIESPGASMAYIQLSGDPGDATTNWTDYNDYTNTATMVTATDETSGGGDSSGTGFIVSGAGHTDCNGTYLESGTYENYPLYQYSIYYLRRITTGNWQISDGTVTYYMGTTAESPDLSTWSTGAGASPAPAVTAYVGGGESSDTTIVVPEAVPETGAGGIKISNVFIPVCPNPADSHLSKVSPTGRNIALGWMGYGTGTEITSLDVQFQAMTDGWLSASVTSTAGGQYLELLTYRDASDNEHTYGNTRFAYASGATLRGVLFVPRGFFYKIKSDAALVKAMWYPCKGASE